MNNKENISEKLYDFFIFKINRLQSLETLAEKIEQAISEKLKTFSVPQLLMFFNSISHKKDQSEIDILSLLKRQGGDGSNLPLLGDSNKKENLYEEFFNRLNPRTIQFLLNNPDVMRKLGVRESDLQNYNKLKFMDENEQNRVNGVVDNNE